MSDSIDINFANLETGIKNLQKLKKQLEKPEISLKSSLIKEGGLGDVKNSIHKMSTSTVNYYKAVYSLINNTIAYLSSAKETMKQTDQKLANKINEGA